MNTEITVNLRGSDPLSASVHAMDLARSQFSVVSEVEEPDGTITVTLWPIPTTDTLYGMVRNGHVLFDPVAKRNAQKRDIEAEVTAKYGDKAGAILDWIAGGDAATYFAQRTLDDRAKRGA